MIEYDKWKAEPTPDNLGPVVRALDPIINAEIQRFTGPKPLLRSKARALAVKAIRTYNPTEGAQLRSWVVTQLQPLSRYGQQMRPVHAPEMAIRQSAEVHRVGNELSDMLGRDATDDELADHIGISAKRVRDVRKLVRPTMSEGGMAEPTEEDSAGSTPGVSTVNKLTLSEEAVYDGLDPRDKLIFDLKTGKHGRQSLQNQDIAKRLGVTPALISQRSQQIAMQIRTLHERGVL
jgi:DNA-directed RNA polymerase specialized sigma subunit